ncbi:ribosome biogenesis GTPase [Spiroplasma sabaudiense Ar-1343]|uniref:Small ribosomal subunit biogenesis GTPase RsgA n=1 Tax=Spiroplasma sabaudiense Ar-1343 TaxID=1276257 RepID=W6AAL9_9MOLU|nr:ribosome small subunit-dependent GTPase A [Spiroplasma sabaudiense]AHI54061.1 ribosome biogenesis GTPase [Spiroplasma sabaudiense Ar-1343]
MDSNLQGLILKIVSEYCYVLFENEVFECKAIGSLRHQQIKLTVGDLAFFEILDGVNKKGSITGIQKRRNELKRPRIANIDQVVIVTSVSNPDFASYILNKYLAFVEILEIKPILAFTKTDLIPHDHEFLKEIQGYKKLGYDSFLINNKVETNDNWEAFKNILKNKISVFTGQTGAGKSTTLNHLIPGLSEKTQEISKALNRGRHTTTKNELFFVNNGYIGDTPGFSSFELDNVSQTELSQSYQFFKDNLGKCKFRDCLHIESSPQCFIKRSVELRDFPEFIYNDYLKMIEEIKKIESRKKF